MSCYTPASTARSRSHSPAESSTALSPTQGFKEFIGPTRLSLFHSPTEQSPQLSECEWPASFEVLIDLSAAGTPTTHSDTINGLFQFFEDPIDTHEQLRQLCSIVAELKCACCDRHCQTPCLILDGLMKASKLLQEDRKEAQGRLAHVFTTFHKACGTVGSHLSVRALDVACIIYSATGRADTAMTVLECLIEQDPELVRERYHTQSRLTLDFCNGITGYDEATSRMMCKLSRVGSHIHFNIQF